MDEEQSERKEFFQEQLQWTKEQIDTSLLDPKRITEYAGGNDLSMDERRILNSRLGVLKHEYNLLGKLRGIVVY